MGKFLYAVYAAIVIAIMGSASFSPPSTGSSNPNSMYHGSSWGGAWGSGGSAGGGFHK